MVTKPTKEFTDAKGRRKVKGNMWTSSSPSDAMRLADDLDHIVIFSGDGDFRSLVAALQQKGERVSIISTLQTQPPMVANELRRQADQFVDLADLEDQVGRAQKTRGREMGRSYQGSRTGSPGTQTRTILRRRRPRRRRGLIDLLFCLGPRRYGWHAGGRSNVRPEAPAKCQRCPRLVAYRKENESKEPSWFNGAGPWFGTADARFLIVGLAPP